MTRLPGRRGCGIRITSHRRKSGNCFGSFPDRLHRSCGYYRACLRGGAQTGEVVQERMTSGDAAVQSAAAQTCGHAIFSEATLAVAEGLTDPAPAARPSSPPFSGGKCQLAVRYRTESADRTGDPAWQGRRADRPCRRGGWNHPGSSLPSEGCSSGSGAFPGVGDFAQ
jgi:hypothetical protein